MNMVKLVFAPSPSTDVVSYKLSWGGMPEEMIMFPVEALAINADGNIEIILNDAAPQLDGTYNFAIVAIDDAGNESQASIVENLTVDFLAPEAPGPISVVYV